MHYIPIWHENNINTCTGISELGVACDNLADGLMNRT